MRRLALLVALVLVPLTGCGEVVGVHVAGRIVDDSVVVQIPALSQPRVNLDAGFTPSAPGIGRPTANLAPTQAGLGSVVRVASVEVSLGQRVAAGDVLLRLDDRQLAADVTAAKADATVGKRQIAVLDSTIADTYNKDADLNDARAKLRDALTQLTTARRQLTVKLAQARAAQRALPGNLAMVNTQLAAVTTQLQQASAALAALPPAAPPEQRAALEAAVAQLTAGRTKLLGVRGQLTAAIQQLKVGVPKLTKALGTIDSGLAKVRRGLRTINSAKAKLADARTQLRGARKLAVVAADAGTTAVDVARVLRSQAVVLAPAAGVVSELADPGAMLAAGATAATITPDVVRVASWLSPAQLATVCVGDHAQLSADWLAQPVAATLSRIGDEAVYPPTSQPTDEVHLTRAVQVYLTLDAPADLPAGVPLDVQLSPCHPAGAAR